MFKKLYYYQKLVARAFKYLMSMFIELTNKRVFVIVYVEGVCY